MSIENTNPQVGDRIKIRNLIDSDIVEISENIYKLENGNLIMLKENKWFILVDVKPTDIEIYKKDYELSNMSSQFIETTLWHHF